MSNVRILYSSDRLYKKDSHGNLRVWHGEAFIGEDGGAYAKTIAGVIDSAQKQHVTEMQPTPKYTREEAAEAKIRNAETAKLKKGYFRTIEEARDYKPSSLMLVHKYPEYANKLQFPVFVQPKLDGICAGYMDDPHDPHFKSREDNRFEKLDGLALEISRYLDAYHGVDRERMDAHGELYTHGKTVGELVEGLKGSNEKALADLEFFVFDFMPGNADGLWFQNRLKQGMKYYGCGNVEKPFRLVRTLVANDQKDIEAHYKSFVSQGYEGVILINRKGMYEYDKRTYDKLKYKQLHSEEFEITGVDVEVNGSEELIMFRCKTKDGVSFKVRPKWDHERRKAALEQQRNGSIDYVGEMATVEYRSLTSYGTPFHGVLIATRNYE